MAVRTRHEILESLRARIGDSTDDDTLAFIEDVTDTLYDYETRVSDSTNWRERYETNDAEWRQRYRDRFFGNPESEVVETDNVVETETEKPMTFEDLFKEE